MRLVLLGTGGPDGWPSPFCDCVSCLSVAGTADARGRTSVLVDSELLIGVDPAVLGSAGRFGVSVRRVRYLLLAGGERPAAVAAVVDSWLAARPAVAATHLAADGSGEPGDGSGEPGPGLSAGAGWRVPVQVVGPARAVDRCRAGMPAPDRPGVRWRGLPDGGTVQLGRYTVRLLPGSDLENAPYEIRDGRTGGDGGARLLFAGGRGRLTPGAVDALVAADGVDVALLGGNCHELPVAVAALRRAGAVATGCRLIAVGGSHDNPPPSELAPRLAAWGVELLRDGADVTIQGGGPAGRRAGGSPRPPRTLVLGGARSGKSEWAEALLAAEPAVTYLATAPPRPGDPDWARRVAAHRERRLAHWRTVESAEVAGLLAAPPGPVLVDDLGNWLTRWLDAYGGWDGPAAPTGLAAVRDRMVELVAAWRGATTWVVAVSSEVGAGVVPATAAGRLFRDELGRLNRQLAEASDQVVLVVAGLPMWLRGDPCRSPLQP